MLPTPQLLSLSQDYSTEETVQRHHEYHGCPHFTPHQVTNHMIITCHYHMAVTNISSVTLLLVIIFYFFAIVGMEVFHDRVDKGCCVLVPYIIHTYCIFGMLRI